MSNFRGFSFTAILNKNTAARLAFASREAKSSSPRLTCGLEVIKLSEAATEAFTATIGFLSLSPETRFSPLNPAALTHLTVVADKEDDDEEGRPRRKGLDVRNNLVVAIVLDLFKLQRCIALEFSFVGRLRISLA
jgi:hypothetical protein